MIPIHKSGNSTLPTNWRPISLTDPFSKLIERCIHSQLIKFFEKYKLIHPNQFGFQKGVSTEAAINQVYEELASGMDSKELTCAIFLDIRKAFDSINHKLLINKLSRYGIRGTPLKLLSSFLQNRQQSVFVNGVKSKTGTVKCGVPQGSVLGPLLFLCFINDLPNASSKFKTLLFADDACLISRATSVALLESKVNEGLKLVSNWLANNKLCLNYDKTVFLFFSNQRSTSKLNLMIDNNIIKQANTVKYLGVLFDDKLCWAPQVTKISNKISTGCWAIANLKKYADIQTLRMVYFALIYPHLNYGISCWGSAARYILNKVYTKQKWALKVITGSDFRSHSTPLFHKLSLLKLDDICKLKIAMEIRKLMLNNQLYRFNIKFSQSVHKYTTRSSVKENLAIPSVNKNIGKSTLKFKGAIIWNELPVEFRNKPISHLKFKYKNWLIENYNEKL